MEDVIKDSEVRMKKAEEHLKKNFAAVRTGRASPNLLDNIKVSYYGTDTPLKQIASVSAPEPRMLIVTPYDKNAAADIEKAIMTSNLGINPKREASLIRISIPELSEERRRDFVKLIKKETEDAKVAIRNIRREAIDVLKKQKGEKEITEDDEKNQDKKVQELTDKFCKEMDNLFTSKEKEVMEV